MWNMILSDLQIFHNVKYNSLQFMKISWCGMILSHLQTFRMWNMILTYKHFIMWNMILFH